MLTSILKMFMINECRYNCKSTGGNPGYRGRNGRLFCRLVTDLIHQVKNFTRTNS